MLMCWCPNVRRDTNRTGERIGCNVKRCLGEMTWKLLQYETFTKQTVCSRHWQSCAWRFYELFLFPSVLQLAKSNEEMRTCLLNSNPQPPQLTTQVLQLCSHGNGPQKWDKQWAKVEQKRYCATLLEKADLYSNLTLIPTLLSFFGVSHPSVEAGGARRRDWPMPPQTRCFLKQQSRYV